MSNGFDRIDAEDPTGIELLPHPTVQEWREFRAAVSRNARSYSRWEKTATRMDSRMIGVPAGWVAGREGQPAIILLHPYHVRG